LYIYELKGYSRELAGELGEGLLGVWVEGEESYVFFRRPAAEELKRAAAAHGLELVGSYEMSYEQWQGGQVGEVEVGGLKIVPVWYGFKPGPRVLVIDPGVVFGGGAHPTTRLCLELLAMRAREGSLGRVVDLGCGSGILGLAAARWGAKEVVGVDLNPLCVELARANAELNGIKLTAVEADAVEAAGWEADVVVANLPWAVLSEMLEGPLGGKGDVILGGLLRSQAREALWRLERLGYRVRQQLDEDFCWFAIWAVGG